MRVLVIGSGGREHALAWKLAQSPHVDEVLVAPGNGGTAKVVTNVPVPATDIDGLVQLARERAVDLAVVGPEAPLVAGLVDAFQAAGLRAFGPSAASARLESSKAFAKTFMVDCGIPTAPARIFDDYEAARAALAEHPGPVVVKASGLAAGKGVLVCDTQAEAEVALRQVMVDRAFGAAGDLVLLEERLAGDEVSLLAFTDGRTVVPMLPAHDYKRALDGDRGLNTGGMGGYAPSPILTPDLVQTITDRILQPTVDGMREWGTPYTGVLYAGLMLTDRGPMVLEYNARFGDPETQILLPLLETDLVDIIFACMEGRLAAQPIRWRAGASVGVVLTVGGYPDTYTTGDPIEGLASAGAPGAVAFHAGTRRDGDRVVTAGGRVLTVTAQGPTVEEARQRAYAIVDRIRFRGMAYRHDIARTAQRPTPGSAYAASGVDLGAGERAVDLMKAAVRRTYTADVLDGIGAFGGSISVRALATAHDLVLVATTDGVGTKTMIAEAMGVYNTVGHDIVNHCVNDVLVQGARPLLFLDYIASAKLDPVQIATVVGGCAAACEAVGCVLIGGETAEMPGVYQPGSFDLVGTMIGWVDRTRMIDGSAVRSGDVCLGLRSSGLHTNGFSLARRVLGPLGWDTVISELGQPLGRALLAPHRPYLREVEALWDASVSIRAIAHITGGGFVGNVPRVLPESVGVRLRTSAWEVPALFRLIQREGKVRDEEMYRTYNMGIGLVLVIAADEVNRAITALPELVVIGETTSYDGTGPRVRLDL